ncbi:MAG TPA: methyl-accepting chemotaxis protein, partial [Steroidobacteraceae bacterium]|nr:methyl-accepting chemotaxis protein [Steroidobacteraceae bacterium]
MTVKMKMIVLVVAALIGIVALAGTSRIQIARVYDSASFGTVNALPSILALDDAAGALFDTENTLGALAVGASTHYDEAKAQLDKARDARDAAFKRYESLVADDKDKQLLEADIEAAKGLKAAREQFFAAIEQKKQDEARAALIASQAAANKVMEALQAHRVYNNQLGVDGGKRAVEVQHSAELMSLILAAATLLVLGGMGFFITSNLLKQLGGEPDYAATVLRSVASGDLALNVQTHANDQTSMLYAVKAMVERLRQVIGEVNSASDALASAADEVSQTAHSLSQSASEQATGVEQTSTSVEQMTSSIAQNSENAKVTNTMATKAAQ